MSDARIPTSLSVYEALRACPDASPRLASLGLTRDFYDYRIRDAAAFLGVPLERVAEALRPRQPVA